MGMTPDSSILQPPGGFKSDLAATSKKIEPGPTRGLTGHSPRVIPRRKHKGIIGQAFDVVGNAAKGAFDIADDAVGALRY